MGLRGAAAIVGFHELVAEAKELGESRALLTHRGLTLRTMARKLGAHGENLIISTDDISDVLAQILDRTDSRERAQTP